MDRAHLNGWAAATQAPRAPSAERRYERLGKTLALLSSSHDGERLAAADAANRQLADLGLDWPTLVARAFLAPTGPRPQPRPARRYGCDPRSQIAWLRSCGSLLTRWEREFISSLDAQIFPITSRQAEKLAEVVARAEVRRGAAAEATP